MVTMEKALVGSIAFHPQLAWDWLRLTLILIKKRVLSQDLFLQTRTMRAKVAVENHMTSPALLIPLLSMKHLESETKNHPNNKKAIVMLPVNPQRVIRLSKNQIPNLTTLK